MTAKYYVDAVEQTDTTVRIKGPHQGLTSNADGSFATSNVQILDPHGTLAYAQLKLFAVTETASTWPRSYTGRIFNLKVSRGPYLTGPGRVYDFEVDDLNGYLHMSILRGASANRPAESGSTRLAWLLTTTGMTGIVFDNGNIMANAWPYPPSDYRGKYADDVLIDIISAATAGRWVFYVYWHPTATSGQEVSLFYGEATNIIRTSTLRLSNIPAHCDDIDNPSAVTYPVHFDPELNRAGSEIYCGVYVDSPFGKIYHHRASTHTTFFGSSTVHRDFNFTSTRINSAATAANYAEGFLDKHAGQIDTITCTTKLPAAKVNLIDAGMRIEVEFEHFPGYETFSFTRIASRTLLPFDGTNAYYDVKLDLSIRGVSQAGGGNPGGFPHPGCAGTPTGGTPTLVQHAAAKTTNGLPNPLVATFGSAPTPGNEILAIWTAQAPDAPTFPAGYTALTITDQASGLPYTGGVVWAAIKTVGSGEGSTVSMPGTGSDRRILHVFEVSAGAFSGGHELFAGPATLTGVMPNVTTTEPQQLLIALGTFQGTGFPASPPSGWTVVDNATFSTQGSVSLLTSVWSRLVTPGTYGGETYTLTLAVSDPTTVVFAFAPCVAEPPSPGQWVYNELVTLTAGAGTTANPFAAGSLHVRYDIIDQTPAIVTQTPATGAFTMPSQPPLGTQVFVDYQGA